MNKEISIKDIYKFQQEYLDNNENTKIEKQIQTDGLTKTCLNEELVGNLTYEFNIEIPEVKVYNQKNSKQCNIYACLRVIKSIIQKDNPTINIHNLNLSANYLDFYDKLEKINTLYNHLLTQETLTLENINSIVNRYLGTYGTFHYGKELIKKYGLVPTEFMPEVSEKYDADAVLELLKAKIKSDATILLDKTSANQEIIKSNLMNEAYKFLAKVMGNPPLNFEYKNKSYTPLEFKDYLLPSNLDDYITVSSYDQEVLKSSYAFVPSVYLNEQEEIKTLDVMQIKNALLKQLQDGIAVWFSSEESTTLDYETNILDDQIYRYNELLNIKSLTKQEKLTLDITNYDHAMCITGLLTDNGTIKQFKVDNSFGKHGKYQGHLIMTNSFFENAIITLVIHKKYLP